MMNRFNSFLFTTILFLSRFSLGTARYRKDGNPSSRNIVVQNRAGCKIDFFWIHPQTKELAGSNTDGGLVNGGDSSINSYVTHSFEVQELPSKKTGTCKQEECRKAYFTVSANEDQIFIVDENFVVTVEDHKTRARRKAKEALEECQQSVQNDTSLSDTEKIDRLADCMEQQLALSMQETADEIQFQSQLRKQMGRSWSTYACRDTMNTTTTTSIVNSTWTFQPARGQKQKFKTQKLFESDYSKIQRVQQFVTGSECHALRQAVTHDALPRKAKSSNKLVGLFMEKVEQLVSYATEMTANIDKDPLMQVRWMEPTQKQEDCSIDADGSTTCHTTADLLESDDSMIRVTLANEDNVLASVLVLCETPDEGGEIFFTKTGTTFLPKDIQGDAIVILHEVNAQREEDPFVDEYVICPVRKGRLFALSEEMAK
ncbi:hypothetical protein FisN_3Lh232 [Fistulifera solaris]|uniref:GOLD domain-containing protein n=1 Tax=Fistulifera solaris TaxID=1519565 RepID=A0A1Z5JP97_FISSO|nr:hypothetical protein FisN_3Lh232 [Fistulifera solaris]|eukprot:GAX15789.1 hypothetical protein FisN_3Lh232 [Fistulifera solaris]